MSDSRSRIPSPARSLPMTPRRRQTARKTRSVCSPARSTVSDRLSCIIREQRELIGSLSLSPLSRKSVLTDNTDIEHFGRKSWWKDLDDHSRDLIEVLKDDNAEPCNVFENIDVLSLEEKHHTLDLPESSNSESIQSIIVPQRKLFREKENQPQKMFNPFGTRDILCKLHKENAASRDKTVSTTSKKLFRTESRPVIPAALPDTLFSNTSSDYTMTVVPEKKRCVHNFFNKQQNQNLNHQNTLHKNMFAKFIESDSEDDIPEIKTKFCALRKQTELRRPSLRRKSSCGLDNSMASSIDIDDWQLLPSSTMVDFQLNTSTTTGHAPKRTKLSKLSDIENQMKNPDDQNQGDQDKSKEIQIQNQIEHKKSQRVQDKSQEILNIPVEKDDVSEAGNDKGQEILNETIEKDNINEAANNKNQIIQDRIQEVHNETVEKNNINKTENNESQRAQDKSQEIHKKSPANYTNKSKNNESQRPQGKIQEIGNKSAEKYNISEAENNNNLRAQDKCQEICNETVEKDNIDEVANSISQRAQDNIQEIDNEAVQKDNINKSENNESQKAQGKSQEIHNKSPVKHTNKAENNRRQDKSQEICNEIVEKDNINEIVNNKSNRIQEIYNESVEKDSINKADNNESQRAQDRTQKMRNEAVKKDNINEAEHNKSQTVQDNSHEMHKSNGAKLNEIQKEIEVRVNGSKKTIEQNKNEEENHISHSEIQDNTNQSQEELEQNEKENNEIQDEIEDDVNERQEEIEQSESEKENNEFQDDIKDDESQEEIKQNERENEEENNEIQGKIQDDVNESQEEVEQHESEEEVDEIHDVNESQEENEQNTSESEKDINKMQDKIEDDVNESQEEIKQNERENEEENNEIQGKIQDDVNESQEEVEQHESEEEVDEIHDEIENDVNESQEENKQNKSESEEEINETQDELEDDGWMDSQEKVEQNESEIEDDNSNTRNEIEDDVNEIQEEIEQTDNEDENNEVQDDIEDDVDESQEENDQNESESEEEIEDENESQEKLKQNESGIDQELDYEENGSLEVARYRVDIQKNVSGHAINAKSVLDIKETSYRKSKGINQHSICSLDGSKNSSDAGSGWDSHGTTRKTLRQTFGKDFSIRKSLRAMVIAKTAKARMTAANDATMAKPQANSTEFPEPEMTIYDDEMQEPPASLEVSMRTKQAIIVERLEAAKRKRAEESAKLEEEIKKRLAQTRPHAADRFAIPTYPVYRRPLPKPKSKAKNSNQKQALIAMQNLPKEFIEDMNYKPPKRFAPRNAAWLTKRLYKYLETKLEPRYNYKARVRAEKFAQDLYEFVQQLRKRNASAVAPQHAVDGLKREMARLNIVQTHIEFYNFFNDFLPVEARRKVIPDIINKIPHPRSGLFSNILEL